MPVAIRSFTAGAISSLPETTSTDAMELIGAVIACVDDDRARALIQLSIRTCSATAWTEIANADLPRWSDAARGDLLGAVRALPNSRERIAALCKLTPWLSLADKAEAFAGILDGTFPETGWPIGMPVTSYFSTQRALLVTCPDDWQESWVATRTEDSSRDAKAWDEAYSRSRIDHWPEEAVRRLWAGLSWTSSVPGILSYLVPRLPPDLRELALDRVRRTSDPGRRRFHLRRFERELTQEELDELVRTPGDAIDTTQPHGLARHLHWIKSLLPRVRPEVWMVWLHVAEGLEDADRALAALLGVVGAADRRRCVDRLVRRMFDEDFGVTPGDVLPSVEDDVFEALCARAVEYLCAPLAPKQDSMDYPLLRRLYRIDHFKDFIDHARTRPGPLRDRCLETLLVGAINAAPVERVAALTGAMPWLDEILLHAAAAEIADQLQRTPELLPKPEPPEPEAM
jgi:hypothetical protein